MPNALQMFLQSIASGQQDVTRPFAQGFGLSMQRQQQQLAQQAFQEKIRQFNLAQPAKDLTARARGITAQTGAGRLASDIDWRAQWGDRRTREQQDALARSAAQQGIGREKELARVAATKETARQGAVTKGYKDRQTAKADIAGKRQDPILYRQLLNRIAQARHAITVVETAAGGRIVGNYDPARAAAEQELRTAEKMFEGLFGRAPDPQEVAGAAVSQQQQQQPEQSVSTPQASTSTAMTPEEIEELHRAIIPR